MNEINTFAPAPATVTEQIDFALQCCSDYGIEFVASDAAELLSGIENPEDALPHLEELSRLLKVNFGLVDYIQYVDDHMFHKAVSGAVAALRTTVDGVGPSEDDDRKATEALLAAGIWPKTWEHLMDEEKRRTLISRIVSEQEAGL